MKSFYQKSIQLWTITRGILILIFGIDALTTNYAQDQYHPLTFAGDLRNLLFLVVHGIICYHELRGKLKPFLTRALAGGLSFLLALSILYTAIGPIIFLPDNKSHIAIIYLAWIPVVIWVFLFGLYDAMDIQPFEDED